MVDSVARLRERRPEIVDKTFEGIRSLVSNARLAIEAGDRFALGRLMDLNQMLLSGLYVSTPEIERMCALAREAGALGAKLTGAGGGGSVVALVPSSAVAEAVLAAWKAEKFDGFATCVAPEARARVLESETAPLKGKPSRSRIRTLRSRSTGESAKGRGTSPRCRASP
jgi:mevalonate kinase